jgi:hypothetical protein
LRFSDGMNGKGCLTGRFRAVNLDDTSAGISSHTKSHIEADGTCGNNFYLFDAFVAHFHDRAFTKALFYLVHGSLQGFQFFARCQIAAIFKIQFVFFCHVVNV